MANKPLILRNDAEEERDDADAGTQLKKFIADAMTAMDGMSKRMDSMEERFAKKDEERDDSTVIYRGQKAPNPNRKDEENEKAKKDAEEKERMDAEEKDRKDAEEKEKAEAEAKKDEDEKKARDDAARKDSESSDRLKRLETALGDVVAVLPKVRTDEDYHAMCDVQARADEAYSALGQRSAPRFLDGEDSLGYRRRLVRDLKKHSPDWKDVNIHAITDDSAFSVMERRVYADAMDVARSPVTAEPGTLRAVTRRSGGHEITEYVGEPSTWMNAFAGPARQFVTSNISNGAQR